MIVPIFPAEIHGGKWHGPSRMSRSKIAEAIEESATRIGAGAMATARSSITRTGVITITPWQAQLVLGRLGAFSSLGPRQPSSSQHSSLHVTESPQQMHDCRSAMQINGQPSISETSSSAVFFRAIVDISITNKVVPTLNARCLRPLRQV